MRALNLATHPFRNERLPTLLAVVSLGGALVLSAYHVLLARDVMPDRTSSLTQKLSELEAESARLRTEAAGLRSEKPEAGALAEWTQLKDLVDRRVFSWTGLLSVLEDTVPDGVRLIALSPKVEKGQVSLDLSAVARTFEEAMDFQHALEERPEFSEVYPQSRATAEGQVEYQYKMTYLPRPRKPAVSKAPSPPAPASAAEPGRPAGATSADARMLRP